MYTSFENKMEIDMKPKISVIIPVYNTGKYLARCLDSVLEQTFTDFEIICINDGSTDNSGEILAQYAKTDKRIKIINQTNSGVVNARNNGVEQSTADLIFPLDSDDIILPTALEKMYTAINAKRGDIITCRVARFGGEHGEMVLPRPSKINMARQNCLVNAALMRKSDFKLAGGYSHDCDVALEDYDLWLNLVFNHNKKIYRIPEILFLYRIKDASESRNFQQRKQHEGLVKEMKKKYNIKQRNKFLTKIQNFIYNARSCFDDAELKNENISFIKKVSLFTCFLFHSANTYQNKKINLITPRCPIIPNPRLIMVLLVKNEDDIIRENIEFHKAMGVDSFIVTDNASTDNTRQILEEYYQRGWISEIIDEPAQDYSQVEWVNRMIELAKNKYHADWVISADADEFWRSKSGNLKNEISASAANLIYVPIFNMLDRCLKWSDNTQMIVRQMPNKIAKRLINNGKLSKSNQFGKQIPKVVIRAADYLMIHMGNHNADMISQHKKILSTDLVIYHYNSRGLERFKQKVLGGGAAVSRNKKLSKDTAAHWRYFYNGYKSGKLDIVSEYRKSIGIYCSKYIEKLTITDTFVHDFLRLKQIESVFPTIMPFPEMLNKIKNGASIVRYGDGEFDTMMQMNKHDTYQRFNENLANRLLEILKYPTDDKLLICIPPFDCEYNNILNFKNSGFNFWQWYWLARWDLLSKYFVNKKYGNSFFSRDAVFHYLSLEQLRTIWDGKDVVFVVPANGRFVYDDRLFNNIKSKHEVHVPATHAFDEYDRILSECLQYSADKLFFIAAGPTATVLAYDLAMRGYHALDMGHFTNCYLEYLGQGPRPERLPKERPL